MQSGIDKLFNSMISEGFETSKEWKKCMNKLTELDEEFTALIDGDEKLKKLYEEINKAFDELNYEESKSFFINGYSLGLCMGKEAADTVNSL